MPDITTTQIFTDGEKGITATKMNNIIANSVIQPDFVTTKPSSSTLDPTDQLLEVKGAGTYARITGQQLIDSVSASVTQNITPTIWSVRLRSFNAVGNPTFEVDQRTVGTGTNVGGGYSLDRWQMIKTGSMVGLAQQQSSNIVVPGTNFAITQNFLRVTVNTAQATLAAGDYYQLMQVIEGPNLRELISDVHSISLLVRSSVAGLKFGLSLRNGAITYYLTKLCTISSANTWTLITFPNIPVWTASGVWNLTAGNVGYYLNIVLACGSTNTALINDTWQSGSLTGAAGQSNLFANAGATADFAFLQHEPGAQCSTPIDCPFTKNYDDCLRYYAKSYEYGIKPGTVTSTNPCIFFAPSGYGSIWGTVRFPKSMAKGPTVTIINPGNGVPNQCVDALGASYTASGTISDTTGICNMNISPNMPAGVPPMRFHYTADTGW